MNHDWLSECPDESTLRRLGLHDDVDERTCQVAGSPADAIECHIESCLDCQRRLEELAARERHELSDLLTSASHSSTDLHDIPELADYRILRELGRGERSRVYLAEELSTARLVALKLIPIAPDNSTDQRAQWLAEVRAAARVEHQNVVRLYRVDEADHYFLLVFEYVAGGTLRDWQATPASQLQIAAMTQIIAQAVHQIHQRNILHLDLKPSNILIDITSGTTWDTIVPKVSDFGIASGPYTPVLNGSQSPLVRGTPAYMAPEQFLGDPSRLIAATDVYALGGILYCLLSGRPPIIDDFVAPTLEAVLLTEITPPHLQDHTIDIGLSAIAMRCLEKHPADRFATPLELADALQNWMAPHAKPQKGLRIAIQQATSAVHTAVRATTKLEMPTVTRCLACATGIRAVVNRTSVNWAILVIVACVMVLLSGRRFLSSTSVDSESAGSLPVSGTLQIAASSSLPVTVSAMLNRMPHDSANRIDVEHLVAELSELPPAFSVIRAARLVIDNRRFTDRLLAEKDIAIDECLRFGVLQSTSASRFQESGLQDLYPAARFLLNDSHRLLEYVVRRCPDDQTALEKLIMSRALVSSLRVETEQTTADAVKRHLAECSESLRSVVSLITRLRDPRQRIFWAGYVLDTYRLKYWHSVFGGDAESAALLAASESQAWVELVADQSTPDLMFRHAMMHTKSEAEHVPTVNNEPWILKEHQAMLQQESIYIDVASQFFSLAETSAETDPLKWKPMLQKTAERIRQSGLDEALLPRVIHEDLIRPLTTFSTRHRIENDLDRAEHLQRSYLSLCEAAMQMFPGNSDVHLAFSEAWLQTWKNALRRDQTDDAVAALQRSLEEAQLAVNASPTCVRARDQVADRIKRLARIQVSLPRVTEIHVQVD